MLRPILALFAVGSLGLAGCGTFADAMCGPVDDHVYYRGVRLDVRAITEDHRWTTKVLMAADIPFSAVADTLLIPHYARLHREAADRRLRSEGPPVQPRKPEDDAPTFPISASKSK